MYPTVGAFATDLMSMLQSSPSQPILEYKINIPSYTPPAGLIVATPKDLLGPAAASEILPKIMPVLVEAKRAEQELHIRPLPEKAQELEANPDHEMTNADDQIIPEAHATSNNVSDIGSRIADETPAPIENDQASDDKPGSPLVQLLNESCSENQISETDNINETQPERLQDSSVVLPPLDPDPELGARWDNGRPPWYLKNFAPLGLRLEAEVWSPLSEPSDGESVEDLNLGDYEAAPPQSLVPFGEFEVTSSVSDRDQGHGMHSKLETVRVPEGLSGLQATMSENDNIFQHPAVEMATIRVKNQQPEAEGGALQRPELEQMEGEDLMGGFRAEDLPSPLAMSGEEASSVRRQQAFLIASSRVDLAGPPPNPLTIPSAPSNDYETATNNGSVLSDPPDEDYDHQHDTFMSGMERSIGGNNATTEGGANGANEHRGDRTGEGSPQTPTTTPGRKSRKGMIFPRQSNGRFGPTKGTTGGGSSSKKVRRKKW